MGQEHDPRIIEALQLLDSAHAMEKHDPGEFHRGTFQQRHALASQLRARAAVLRREVHGQ